MLVAEDSLVIRALLRSQLRERGYTVVEAADGEQALSRARESTPDVILLDVEMPRMDGFAVLAELKRDAALADVPVIFVSGRTTTEDVVRGLTLGAQDYLRKPFEAAELAARVHAAMRTKDLQDQLRDTNRELAQLATTDAVTGLANRRFLDDELERALSRSARHHRRLALLIVDADRFRAVNDEHGRAVGDRLLEAIGDRLARRLRREDVLGRWGGQEFMVIAPDVEEDGAVVLGEALREVVSATPLSVDGSDVRLTVSVGIAVWRGDDADELIRRADGALHAAKDGGRDRVERA